MTGILFCVCHRYFFWRKVWTSALKTTKSKKNRESIEWDFIGQTILWKVMNIHVKKLVSILYTRLFSHFLTSKQFGSVLNSPDKVLNEKILWNIGFRTVLNSPAVNDNSTGANISLYTLFLNKKVQYSWTKRFLHMYMYSSLNYLRHIYMWT